MARDRKRAKQRRERRAAAGARRGSASGTPPAFDEASAAPGILPAQPIRGDVPGALDHASSDVDEFDAALVAGAGGVPAESDTLSDEPDTLSESEIETEAEREGDLSADELQEAGGPSGPGEGGPPGPGGTSGGGGGRGGGTGGVSPEQASGAPLRGGSRAIGFVRASWAELQRVQWPDRRQTTQATAVVLGFVAIAGVYLGAADYVAKEIVEFIL